MSLFAQMVEAGVIHLPPDWLAEDLLTTASDDDRNWAGRGFTVRDAESTT